MSVLFFWSCFFLTVYVYFLYPVAVALLSVIFNRQVKKSFINRSVTIVIAAYNEERDIGKTIENKLKLDYPAEKLEIIVVSDASTDRTDDIVKSFSESGVRLLRQETRQGKTAAINLAVSEAKGEIIVFSDSNSIYSNNALKELVSNFSDGSIGYVTGKMSYVNKDGSTTGDGCTAYMRYENFLRRLETSIGSVVGVDGGIDAIRRGLFSVMRPDQLPDFILPLKVIEQGYRVVYDHSVLLNEDSLSAPADEYRMRVRVALRALHALKDMSHLLSLSKYGIFAWQLLSHKVLRYGIFFFLIGMYLFNLLIIADSRFYLFTFVIQNMLYFAAFIGIFLESKKINVRIFYIIFYFCLLNMASAHAFWKFLNNEKQVTWVPRKG